MKNPTSKRKYKITIILLVTIGFFGLFLLVMKVNHAYKELALWKSKKEVLEQELQELRTEAQKNREFLEMLRNDPDFQDDVARKELGYGKKDEKVFRFKK